MNAMLLGFKHSKGDYNGRAYDFVTLYLISNMEQNDNQRGKAGIEMRADSTIVEHLKPLNLAQPVLVNLDTEQRAIGKGQFTTIVTRVTPAKTAA